MNTDRTTVDEQEINKFSLHATQWWDKNGPLKTLHDINASRLQWVEQYVSLQKTSVLDVGCGGGIFAEAMTHNEATVTGIDASEEAIAVAKKHAQTTGLTIDYQHIAIEDFEHSGFDVITCMEMLEHVLHPELVIEHCSRLLKPNGLLFLSTINRTLKAYSQAVIAAEYVLKILPRQTHDYNKFIKPSELARIARSFDLQLKGLSGLQYNPFTRVSTLTDDVGVNYLMVFEKSGC